MRVSEIITESAIVEASIFDERTLKNTAWKSPTQLIGWLKQNGFKKLGGGVFAVAYGKPGHNRIVKVSKRQDDCWIKFAQWAMSKTNNKHLPKIPWIKRYQGKRKGKATEFFITIIERLNPLTKSAITKIADPGVLLGLKHFADLDWVTMETIKKNYNSYVRASSQSRKDFSSQYANHPFVRALRQINNFQGKCYQDLHMGNLMQRSDGTVIITDPIAGDFTRF